MKNLILSLSVVAITLGLQSNADAVFVKTLIDNFAEDDGGAPHSSAPAAPAPFLTRASFPAVAPPGAIVPLTAASSDIAVDRELSGMTPPDVASVPAGGGTLSLVLPGPGATVGASWDVVGYDFLADPVFHLVGLANALPVPATLGIALFQDGIFVDGQIVDLAAFEVTDVKFVAPLLPGPTSFIGVEITNLGAFGFVGGIDQVVANPEPGTMALIGLGVFGGAIGYRRRRQDDDVEVVEAEAAV